MHPGNTGCEAAGDIFARMPDVVRPWGSPEAPPQSSSAGLLPRLAGSVALVAPGLLLGKVGHSARGSQRTSLFGRFALGYELRLADKGRGKLFFLTLAALFFFALTQFESDTLLLGLAGEARIVDGLTLGGNRLTARVVWPRPVLQLVDQGQLGRGRVFDAVGKIRVVERTQGLSRVRDADRSSRSVNVGEWYGFDPATHAQIALYKEIWKGRDRNAAELFGRDDILVTVCEPLSPRKV